MHALSTYTCIFKNTGQIKSCRFSKTLVRRSKKIVSCQIKAQGYTVHLISNEHLQMRCFTA